MGYDLVNWWPKNVGDWNPPADTSILEQTVNPSDIPTLAEIEGMRSAWNQIVAAVRRRAKMKNLLFGGTTLTYPSYVTPGPAGRVKYTDLTALRLAINNVRNAEGFASYTWSTTTAGENIKPVHLGELRRALRIAGLLTLTSSIAFSRIRYEGPWGTLTNQSWFSGLSGPTGTFYQGTQGTIVNWARDRSCWSFGVPDWFLSSAIASCNWRFTPTALRGTPTVQIYVSNTDDHLGASPVIADHTDFSIGTYVPVSTDLWKQTLFPVNGATIGTKTGGWCSTVIGEYSEYRNIQPGGTGLGFTESGDCAVLVDFGA